MYRSFLSTHGKQLTPRQARYLVRKALERAGIVKRQRGTHLLRHSGASLLSEKGEDPRKIQYLIGHRSLATTSRYLHFDRQALKEMVARSPRFATSESQAKQSACGRKRPAQAGNYR